MPRSSSRFLIVTAMVIYWALSAVAVAQEAAPPPKDRESLQELSKTHENPFGQSVNVPFQFTPFPHSR